jgi:L-arabinose isomerase
MKTHKPRVGLLLLAAEWFWQQNIQGAEGRYKAVAQRVDSDARTLIDTLGLHFELTSTGLIHNLEQASVAAKQLKSTELDLLIVCSLIWSEDAPLLKILAELPDVPLLVWNYVPDSRLPDHISMAELFRRSGPVGCVQHSGALKRLGKSYGFICGPPDQGVVQEIRDHAQAAQVARSPKTSTIGLLPYRCELMTGTYVDEFRLLRELGLKVRYISIAEYAGILDRVIPSRTRQFMAELGQRYGNAAVSEDSLFHTARASLGLADLAEEYKLDALAISDLVPELHQVIKVRPFLGVPDFFDRGRVLGMEGDLAATAGMLICRRLADTPPMYTEIFTFDPDRNTVLPGHAGMHDVRLADSQAGVRITPDYEYCEANKLEGAWLEFRAKPGRVTMASFFCDVDRFKIVIAQGESLVEGPRLEGFAHLLIRLDVPVNDFFHRIVRSGITQHWVITHQNIQGKLENLAQILNLKCEVVS